MRTRATALLLAVALGAGMTLASPASAASLGVDAGDCHDGPVSTCWTDGIVCETFLDLWYGFWYNFPIIPPEAPLCE